MPATPSISLTSYQFYYSASVHTVARALRNMHPGRRPDDYLAAAIAAMKVATDNMARIDAKPTRRSSRG